VLKLLEWRFGLEPLSQRDAEARNLAEALDFSYRRLAAPRITAPKLVVGAACP
jgi:phospholipase C